MTPEQEVKIKKVINDLWAHDPWMWGNTCANLINSEIDFSAPAIVDVVGSGKHGEYIEGRVTMKDGREFEINHSDGGWSMGYVVPSKTRLTPRVPDAPIGSCEHGYLRSMCPMCNFKSRRAARR